MQLALHIIELGILAFTSDSPSSSTAMRRRIRGAYNEDVGDLCESEYREKLALWRRSFNCGGAPLGKLAAEELGRQLRPRDVLGE